MPFRVNPVIFGSNRFVAGGPDRTLWWSTDGEKWEKGAQVPADGFPSWAMWFRNGAFGNGTFVFMGEGGAKKDFRVVSMIGSRPRTSVTTFSID